MLAEFSPSVKIWVSEEADVMEAKPRMGNAADINSKTTITTDSKAFL